MALDGQSTNSKSKEREGFGALHVDVDLVHALVELGANPAVRHKNKGGSFALNKGDGGRSVGLPIFIESAHWADSIIESRCQSVSQLCICLSVSRPLFM